MRAASRDQPLQPRRQIDRIQIDTLEVLQQADFLGIPRRDQRVDRGPAEHLVMATVQIASTCICFRGRSTDRTVTSTGVVSSLMVQAASTV